MLDLMVGVGMLVVFAVVAYIFISHDLDDTTPTRRDDDDDPSKSGWI